MTDLVRSVRLWARIGYLLAAWALVTLLAVQVFHAGQAVLVSPGDWRAHKALGEAFSLPILPMIVLSVVGWMPVRFTGASLALFGLYALQFLLVYHPAEALPWLAGLHPVSGMAMFALALGAAQSAWRLVAAGWDAGSPVRRALLAFSVASAVLASASAGLQSAHWAWESAAGAAESLAGADEDDVPAHYRALTPPYAQAADSSGGTGPGPDAVAAGRQLAEQHCAGCHAADLRGRQLGAVRSADLVRSAAIRSEQFLMWAITEGSQRGMPAHGWLPEEQRWQLVAYLKSLKP